VSAHAPHHILRFRNVSVHHGRTAALEAVSLDIPCGSSTALLGPNGAGKSTLLRAILGWHPLSSGDIRLGDDHPHHQLPRLAYLPQRQSIDWDFPTTVRAVVEQGRYPALRFFQKLSARDHERVEHALDELGLIALADRQINQLSGGQQQRVFLARALAQGADIFLLDEPFAGLDLLACEELTHLLRTWVIQGRTVIAAVHDLTLARESFNRGVLLDTTLIATGPIAQVLSAENIDRAFRRGRSARENPLHFARTTEFPS
jgi:ABC-type Mn2+/Zn2+ transport system ATPase subunit